MRIKVDVESPPGINNNLRTHDDIKETNTNANIPSKKKKQSKREARRVGGMR